MNKIIAWALKFGSSVIGKLLIKIGTSAISKILEVAYPIVKEAVVIADAVNIVCLQNENLTNEELKAKVLAENKYELTDRELKYFRDEDGIKGMFRYVVAVDYAKAKLKAEGKEVADFIINLAIELIIGSVK